MRNPKFTDELNELISDYANEAFDTGIAFGFNDCIERAMEGLVLKVLSDPKKYGLLSSTGTDRQGDRE